MNMTNLETTRLIIRPFTMNDLDDIHRILDKGAADARENRQKWLDWSVRNYRELANLYQPPYGERAIELKETGQLVGAVGLVPCFMPFGMLPYFRARSSEPVSDLCTAEMGLFWELEEVHRGNGYATEAAQALIDYMFNQLNLKRIVATTEYDNLPSQKVMERLGMTLEHNPQPDPFWFQVVGILENPKLTKLTNKEKANHSVS